MLCTGNTMKHEHVSRAINSLMLLHQHTDSFSTWIITIFKVMLILLYYFKLIYTQLFFFKSANPGRGARLSFPRFQKEGSCPSYRQYWTIPLHHLSHVAQHLKQKNSFNHNASQNATRNHSYLRPLNFVSPPPFHLY